MSEEQLEEKLKQFKHNWGSDPFVFEDDTHIVLKVHAVHRLPYVWQNGVRTTEEEIAQRKDYFEIVILDRTSMENADKYINFDNFTLNKDFNEFAKLQDIKNKHLSLTNVLPSGYNVQEVTVVSKEAFENYLDNLGMIKKIKSKIAKIVRDKFNVLDSDEVTTSAIFANVGYVIKGLEGKYLSLSKGDRAFIKDFMDDQIREGHFKLTVKETLPFYKESIQEIIEIGKGLLDLTGDKRKLQAFSRNVLGEERKSLEACWQLYFDKYLRVLIMNYKEFYPQFIFRPMEGYEKQTRPDFLAVDIYNNIDVIEIKTHRDILFMKEKGRDSYYPSAGLNRAIFQLNKYMDLRAENVDVAKIEDPYTRSLIENNKIYRPRGILIISSKDRIVAGKTDDEISARLEKEIKKLKTTYNNIDIVLFDELIQNLENYVEYLEVNLGIKHE